MASLKIKRKEAIILAIDIGKNSKMRDSDGRTYFENSIYCASMIIKRKILTQSEDHLALILFGSSRTINHLSSEGCYDGIETVADLGIATWDLYNRVNSVSPTNITPSDWISTFVLAADILKNEIEKKVFTRLQIVMFSNLASDISLNNVDVIATCLKMEKIHLSIIGKDCEAISLNHVCSEFLKTTGATAVIFDSVLPKMSYYKQKEVIASSWNAPLIFGDVFNIKVFGYKMIDVTIKSSNWLFNKNYDIQDLTIAKKKHSDDNGEQMEVDNKLPMDNFDFGDEIVPLIDLDTEECTYIVIGQRCIEVLGFVKTTNTQRSVLMGGGSHIFKPHKTDIIAFNAIFKSMVKKREVMLVRRVDSYLNLLNIGVLFPQKEENKKFLVYVSLPYDDENNETYKLPSSDTIKSKLKEKIGLKHTDTMDIDDGNKFVMPEYKYNIGLQSTYDGIVQQILTKVIPKKKKCSKKPRNQSESIMENDYGPRLKDFLKSVSFKPEFFENFPSAKNLIQLEYNEALGVSSMPIKPRKRSIKNAKPPLNELKIKSSIKQEVIENSSAEEKKTIHFGYDEKLDVSSRLIKPRKRSIKNAKPPLNELKIKSSIKQEVIENSSAEENKTIHFGYDEKLDVSSRSIKPRKRSIKNAKPPLNELKKKSSIKQEVFENSSAEENNTIQFGYDEKLDVSNELINRPKTFIKNAEPLLNEFKKSFSIKQEVFENGSAEDINTIHFGYDEELDISNKLINPPKSFIENAEPPSSEFKKTFSIKQEVFENGSAEDINTFHFGYDEELDVSNELINSTKSFIENAEPPSTEFKKTFSIKQEVFENGSAEDINTIHFGYDEELDDSNELINPPKSFIEIAEPPSTEFKKTFSIKQEVFENGSAEDINTFHFGYDEELGVSNELINPPKSFIENAEPPSTEFKKTFSIKQEVFENGSAEDINTFHFGYDEELDVSNKLINPPKSFIENAEPPLTEFKKTFSIKQEGFENGSAEDINTFHFGYDEELDVSNELINPPKSFVKNAEPPLNEVKKTFSIKQEVFENSSAEDNNTIHFGYDEELDVSNELINPTKSFIKNGKPPLNELKKPFSIKQEVFENGSAEDINTIHFGYDEDLDVLNEVINTSKSLIENVEPPLNELKKTFSIKQEVFENSSVEGNNTTTVDRYEELDVSKQCVISTLNPIEDFNKLLKIGFDSAIVCNKMQSVTLNLIKFSTSLEDLMKPIATLKVLRDYYIINNDAKSYNDFMYLAKDTLIMSGKGGIWSKFINSGIGLITNAEIEASDISQESSEEFKTLSGDFDIDFIIDDVVN